MFFSGTGKHSWVEFTNVGGVDPFVFSGWGAVERRGRPAVCRESLSKKSKWANGRLSILVVTEHRLPKRLRNRGLLEGKVWREEQGHRND